VRRLNAAAAATRGHAKGAVYTQASALARRHLPFAVQANATVCLLSPLCSVLAISLAGMKRGVYNAITRRLSLLCRRTGMGWGGGGSIASATHAPSRTVASGIGTLTHAPTAMARTRYAFLAAKTWTLCALRWRAAMTYMPRNICINTALSKVFSWR